MGKRCGFLSGNKVSTVKKNPKGEHLHTPPTLQKNKSGYKSDEHETRHKFLYMFHEKHLLLLSICLGIFAFRQILQHRNKAFARIRCPNDFTIITDQRNTFIFFVQNKMNIAVNATLERIRQIQGKFVFTLAHDKSSFLFP